MLKEYALRRKVISLETAVYKMTGFPAAKFSLRGRGLIREGFYADLVLLDPEALEDRATYLEPFMEPAGFDMVFVNGKLALEKGEATGCMAGRVTGPRF